MHVIFPEQIEEYGIIMLIIDDDTRWWIITIYLSHIQGRAPFTIAKLVHVTLTTLVSDSYTIVVNLRNYNYGLITVNILYLSFLSSMNMISDILMV